MFADPRIAELINRRAFLRRSSYSVGSAALASLLTRDLEASDRWNGVLGGELHVPPKAKRVIHLCMAGGPSHLETLDHKPTLAKLGGQPMPESFTKGQQLAQLQGKKLNCLAPQYEFKPYGKCGRMMSSALPHIGSIADEIAVINSMHTEQINHDPAHTFMNTGSIIPGRPSMGSWLLYGLGAETDELPGYVVMTSSGGGQDQPIASRQWHSGFLPSKFQGVQFNSKGDPVHYVNNPAGVTRDDQRELLDAINRMNGMLGKRQNDPEIATRIAQYEMAFKMQASVPGLMDVSDEPAHVLESYGAKPGDGSFASNCLLARRLAERGVRFIQLYHRGWDHHGGVKRGIEVVSGHVDQATAALVKDLKERGMLDDTLVIWGGEFGRTPMAQGSGRDHHIQAFSLWMAGAGIKGGTTYGSTDELGYAVADNGVSVHDLHATMLQQLGIDHERLTYKFQGLDFKLTGVEKARVVKELLG
ncbi:sulfatase [Haloferula helveola]|uniref:Sulfatase n=1 Tax=Haloferula helveola TaxID=490095 RepID=A0ABN6H4V0_9BACT|nr:sulfatase [Haloferula helveola]